MIVYSHSLDDVTPEKLSGFFVGWPSKPSPRTHLELLRNSHEAVLALDDSTGRVVGFISAISDDVLSAYIPLLEVLPDYQGRGIGRELVRRMLTRLERFYMVDLMCDPQLQPFYRKLGMTQAVGMVIRNFDRKSGT